MEGKNQEDIPLFMKLLSEAVIELNISGRMALLPCREGMLSPENGQQLLIKSIKALSLPKSLRLKSMIRRGRAASSGSSSSIGNGPER